MRLTRDEVVTIASDWVRSHYPHVPAVAMVLDFSDTPNARPTQHDGHNLSTAEQGRIAGNWLVSYACSWDTDELGMPTTPHVLVDDLTGRVELFTMNSSK